MFIRTLPKFSPSPAPAGPAVVLPPLCGGALYLPITWCSRRQTGPSHPERHAPRGALWSRLRCTVSTDDGDCVWIGSLTRGFPHFLPSRVFCCIVSVLLQSLAGLCVWETHIQMVSVIFCLSSECTAQWRMVDPYFSWGRIYFYTQIWQLVLDV